MLNTAALRVDVEKLATTGILLSVLLVRLRFNPVLNCMFADHDTAVASMTRVDFALHGLSYEMRSRLLVGRVLMTVLLLQHLNFVNDAVRVFIAELGTFIGGMIIQLGNLLFLLLGRLLRNFMTDVSVRPLNSIGLIIHDAAVSHHAVIMIGIIHHRRKVALRVLLLSIREETL